MILYILKLIIIINIRVNAYVYVQPSLILLKLKYACARTLLLQLRAIELRLEELGATLLKARKAWQSDTTKAPSRNYTRAHA